MTKKQALDTVDFKIFKPKSTRYNLDSDEDDWVNQHPSERKQPEHGRQQQETRIVKYTDTASKTQGLNTPPPSESDYDLPPTNTTPLDVIRRPIKKRVVHVDPTKTHSAEFATEHIMDGPHLRRPSRKESEN